MESSSSPTFRVASRLLQQQSEGAVISRAAIDEQFMLNAIAALRGTRF